MAASIRYRMAKRIRRAKKNKMITVATTMRTGWVDAASNIGVKSSPAAGPALLNRSEIELFKPSNI